MAKTNQDWDALGRDIQRIVDQAVRSQDYQQLNQTIHQAIDRAVEAEHGCWHSALMHSTNYLSMTKAARALNTTIFVKNAPSTAGVGFNGEGYATLTIATPTGEGLTSARSFTRARRCVLADGFRII